MIIKSPNGWHGWQVSSEYAIQAMKQLDKAGVDMSTIKTFHDSNSKYTMLVYRIGPSLSENND